MARSIHSESTSGTAPMYSVSTFVCPSAASHATPPAAPNSSAEEESAPSPDCAAAAISRASGRGSCRAARTAAFRRSKSPVGRPTAIAAVRTIAVKRRARRISTLCFFMR